MTKEIVEKIQNGLQTVIGEDDISINMNTSAADVEGWDSLANVRLFIELESVFGIRFNAIDIENLENVGEIADLIITKTG